MREHHICPGWMAPMLLIPFRYFSARPTQLLRPFIKPGDTVLDMGCGPGFFTIPMAKLTGPEGKVIAADFQQEMLDITKRRAKRRNLSKHITLHRTEADSINLKESVSFILAAHVVHELPDAEVFFNEAFEILKSGGICLIIEPRGHVDNEQWESNMDTACNAGFTIIPTKSRRSSYIQVLAKDDRMQQENKR
ncbi:class I SAM-dependent methyltransferase [bacterium]|nr:class I SAM-dependent methyltransferase [bacterium]